MDVSSLMVDPDSGQVQGADEFTLSVTPTAQAVWPGGVATYLLTLTASGNFGASVTLTASLPLSLTLSLSPATVIPTAQATLTLTDTHPASPLLPGLWYSVPITASGGGLTRTATAGLLVGGARIYLPLILK